MIYFDFDGTIVDLWPRYCKVFADAAKIPPIPLSEYRDAKRRFCSDQKLAHYFGITLPIDFFQTKRHLLESPQYLKLDDLLLPPKRLLDFFQARACRILTRRRDADAFFQQLAWLGLSPLMKKSIVLHPDTMQTKAKFLSAHRDERITLVGDSFAEWEATSLPDAQVILVRTGLQDPETFPHRKNCIVMRDIIAYIEQVQVKEHDKDVHERRTD